MFGRLKEFDERSRAFPVRELVAAKAPRSWTWDCPITLDQGNVGSCVGNGWAHEAAAKPVPVPNVTEATAVRLYEWAQLHDAYPETPPEEGTSVLAGAKAAQHYGYLKTYRWAFGLQDLVLSVGWLGPAVIGVDWYEGMMETGSRGYIHPDGMVLGGHCVLVNRVNVKERWFGITNSWGKWGVRDARGRWGHARLSFDDMGMLLADQGEACVPLVRSQP